MKKTISTKIRYWAIQRLGGWTQEEVNERIDELEKEIREDIIDNEGLMTQKEWHEIAMITRADNEFRDMNKLPQVH